MTLRFATTLTLMIVGLAGGTAQAQGQPGVATPIMTGGPIVGRELTLAWGAAPGADEYAVRIEGSAGEPLHLRVAPADANCPSGGVCTLIVGTGAMPAGRGQWAVQAAQGGALGEWSRWQSFSLAPPAAHALGLSETASNTSVGSGALAANSSGTGNSGLGLNALAGNIGGNYNTAAGHNALTYNSWGSWNTATGTGALQNNTSGALNVAVGGQALSSNATGSWNTAVGTNALLSNLASYNTAVGGQALLNNVNGVGNTATGMNAIASNNGGNYNTGTGYNALSSNVWGSWNTGIGAGALQQVTSGNLNVAVGGQALATVTTGVYNTAVGTNALLANVANSNTAVGMNALLSNTSGYGNVAVGAETLKASQTGHYNVALGRDALFNSTGSGNTAVGDSAGSAATGSGNIFFGNEAGLSVTSGNSNILIGSTGTASDTAVIRIGAPVAQSATYIAGIHGATSSSGVAVFVNSSGRLGTAVSSVRFKDDIASLGDVSVRVQALRPVRFVYKPGVDDGSRVTQYGLIAEEVAAVIPDLVVRDGHGEAQTVRYHFLPPLLLAEVQRLERERLAQASELMAQSARLATQTTRVMTQEARGATQDARTQALEAQLAAQAREMVAQAREIAELRAMIEALTAARRQ